MKIYTDWFHAPFSKGAHKKLVLEAARRAEHVLMSRTEGVSAQFDMAMPKYELWDLGDLNNSADFDGPGAEAEEGQDEHTFAGGQSDKRFH